MDPTAPPTSEFQAANWLGYSVDMLSKNAPSPLIAADLLASIIPEDSRRAVRMSPDVKTQSIGVPRNETFDVPSNVHVFRDTSSTSESFTVRASGNEVTKSLQMDASFSATYMGVTVSASASFDSSSNFQQDQQYAFLSTQVAGWVARLTDYDKFVNSDLIAAAQKLPPWNSRIRSDGQLDTNVEQEYRDFFHKWGTHTIETAYYGWRYQLQVSASKTKETSTEEFKGKVHLAYLQNSADLSADDKKTVSDFQQSSTIIIRALGGDPAKATLFENQPADAASKQGWTDDIGKRPDEVVVKLNLIPIGQVLGNLSDNAAQAAGLQLDFALFDLQQTCRRRCTVSMEFPYGLYEDINGGYGIDVRLGTFSQSLSKDGDPLIGTWKQIPQEVCCIYAENLVDQYPAQAIYESPYPKNFPCCIEPVSMWDRWISTVIMGINFWKRGNNPSPPPPQQLVFELRSDKSQSIPLTLSLFGTPLNMALSGDVGPRLIADLIVERVTLTETEVIGKYHFDNFDLNADDIAGPLLDPSASERIANMKHLTIDMQPEKDFWWTDF